MTLADHTSHTRSPARVTVRNATPADHPQIRAVLRAAYGQFALTLPPAVFRPYQADLLDLETHARHGSQCSADS